MASSVSFLFVSLSFSMDSERLPESVNRDINVLKIEGMIGDRKAVLKRLSQASKLLFSLLNM